MSVVARSVAVILAAIVLVGSAVPTRSYADAKCDPNRGLSDFRCNWHLAF